MPSPSPRVAALEKLRGHLMDAAAALSAAWIAAPDEPGWPTLVDEQFDRVNTLVGRVEEELEHLDDERLRAAGLYRCGTCGREYPQDDPHGCPHIVYARGRVF